MEYKYNAFISYRHTPIDARIAVEIQHRLERYTIPKGLQIKDKKRIIRVFRDKEELPTTSNLNDDILRALAQSEYLIVVCSTHTEESIWVKREIDIFLQIHPRNNVITVLAEGEPQNVIPEVLRFEKRLETDEEGREYTVKVPVEPLSCDYRGNIRTARRDELPRLVATLLSVEYDQLKQRRKTYLMQRITAAALISLALMTVGVVYAVQKNMVISRQAEKLEEEYRQLVMSQSRSSTLEAKNALAEYDITAAIKYAIQAIPDDLEQFPVLPEAEKTLVKALGVYQAPLSAKDTVIPTGNLKKGAVVASQINHMLLGCNGKYLLVDGDYNKIDVLDTESLKQLNTVESELLGIDGFSKDALRESEPELVYIADDTVFCVNYLTSEVRWTAELGGNTNYCAVKYINHEKKVAILTNDTFYILDAKTGEVESVIPVKVPKDSRIRETLFASEDGSKIAFSSHVYKKDKDGYYQERSTVNCLDVATQSVSTLREGYFETGDMLFLNNGRLLISSTHGDRFGVDGVISVEHSTAYLQCYDLTDNTSVWETKFPFGMANRYMELKEIKYQTGEKKKNAVVFTFSNHSKIVEEKTGKLLNAFEYNDSVLRVSYGKEAFGVYPCNGERVLMFYNGKKLSYQLFFSSGLADLRGQNDTFFTKTEGDEIVRYQIGKVSDRYEKKGHLENTANLSFLFREFASNSSGWVYLDSPYQELDDWGVTVVDKSTWQERHTVLPEIPDKSHVSILGFSEDEKRVYILTDTTERATVCVVNLESEGLFPYSIPESDGLLEGKTLDITAMKGKIYYTEELLSKVPYEGQELTVANQIGVFEWVPGEQPELVAAYELFSTENLYVESGENWDGEKQLYYTVTEGQEYVCDDDTFSINPEQDTLSFIVKNFDGRMLVTLGLSEKKIEEKPLIEEYILRTPQWCASSPSGRYLMECDDEVITVWDQSGNKSVFVPQDDVNGRPQQAFFTPGEEYLVVVYSELVVEYEIETGEKVNEATLSLIPVSQSYRGITPIAQEGEACVIIWGDEGCSVLNANPDAFGECYSLDDCVDYNSEKDCFIILGDGEIGEIRRYSVEDLKELGKTSIDLEK